MTSGCVVGWGEHVKILFCPYAALEQLSYTSLHLLCYQCV